ncbi:hypothetical protein HDU86_005570 [Geranomyces michiganensis]|nr:hypothetical protein HDU86_005570 [Geranomyces michiganensis]
MAGILKKVECLDAELRMYLFNHPKEFDAWLVVNESSRQNFTQDLRAYGSPELVNEWALRIILDRRSLKRQAQRKQRTAVLPRDREKKVLTVQRRPKDDLGPQKVISLTKHMDFEIQDQDTGEMVLFASRTVTADKTAAIHFQALKMIVHKHCAVERGKSHLSSGLMAATGIRSGSPGNFAARGTARYVLKKEHRKPETERILTEGSSSLAKGILNDARVYHADAVLKMEQVANGKFSGDFPMFVTENYKAGLHVDDNKSEYAIGYATEEGALESSTDADADAAWIFNFPEYGVSIVMEHNFLWSWKTTRLHGTTVGKMRRGTRYTGVLTVTNRTARAVEKFGIVS